MTNIYTDSDTASEYIGGRLACIPEDQFYADGVTAYAIDDDGICTIYEFADGSRCKIDADGNIFAV